MEVVNYGMGTAGLGRSCVMSTEIRQVLLEKTLGGKCIYGLGSIPGGISGGLHSMIPFNYPTFPLSFRPLYSGLWLTHSDFHFRNQNVLEGAIFFFWNQYSNIVRKKLSN